MVLVILHKNVDLYLYLIAPEKKRVSDYPRDFPSNLKPGPGATESGKNNARVGKIGKIKKC